MKRKYEDIIHLPHKQSNMRTRMPVRARAAQFAPFEALVGYGDAIDETVRRTDAKLHMSDDEIEKLNQKLIFLSGHTENREFISVTYFVPDLKKVGGAYRTVTGTVEDIDRYRRMIQMSDGTFIPFADIAKIDGECFDDADII